VQIIKGSFLEKGDIIYEVVEDGDKFIATVTIATMGTSFIGAASASKKEAERSAAEAAVDSMQAEIAAADEAHQSAKKLKKQEMREIFANKRKEAKAAAA